MCAVDDDTGASAAAGHVHELIERSALTLLRERGPLRTEEIADALVAAGLGEFDDLAEAVEFIDDPAFGLLADGRNVALDVLFEGRTLTHRLTARERAMGVIRVDPDLSALELLVADGDKDVPMTMHDGRVMLVVGPAAVRGAELVGLTCAHGKVSFVKDVPVQPVPGLAERIDAIVGTGCLSLDTVVCQLMADDPELFTTPAPPLHDALAGFARRDGMLARAGFDFDTHRREQRIGDVSQAYDVDRDTADSIVGVVDALDGGQADARAVGTEAAAFGLLDQLRWHAMTHEQDPAPVLHRAAQLVAESGGRRVQHTAFWLAAHAAQSAGNVLEAEQLFEQAVAANDRFVPALLDLARYASDRGDASRAASLLTRVPDGDLEPLYSVVAQYLSPDGPAPGRNDPCWCGSGRKYKACHLGRVELSLARRLPWVYEKAVRYLQDDDVIAILLELGVIRFPDRTSTEALIEAVVADRTVVDVTLFEGELLAEFLDERGPLLPADERELLGSWVPARHSVYEVLSVSAGVGCVLADAISGARFELADPDLAAQLTEGEHVWALLVPVADTPQLLNPPVKVTAAQRELLLDADLTPPEILTALGPHR